MTPKTLASAMGNALPLATYTTYLPAFEHALVLAECNTVPRVAMFCAQTGTESGGLKWTEELASGREYEGRADLGNTHPGDGPRFKGAGIIQVTGRNNYGAFGRWAHSKGLVDSADYFIAHPERLRELPFSMISASWYWTVARDMNAYADREDIVGATRAVNGGTNGLEDRRARWRHALSLGSAILPTPAWTPDKSRPVPLQAVVDQFLIAAGAKPGKVTLHNAVALIQQGLNDHDGASLTVDGLAGEATLAAYGHWKAHHPGTAGTRPRVPDEKSLTALAKVAGFKIGK